MSEILVALCVIGMLIVYALTGGADFGGGIWDLLASGPRADRQRTAIAAAIGPIWEANHVWLILAVVLLFTGFPDGFAAIMTALNIPVTVMLIGIVLRGSAFVFGRYDPRSDPARRRWSTLFGLASFLTPFCQGLILGALATGRIRVAQGQVTTGFLSGWMTAFALSCGLFALGLFAFLAATYLTVDTRGQPDLQSDFRRRAIWADVALWPIAALVLVTARGDAPAIFAGLTNGWGSALLGGTVVVAAIALIALRRRSFGVARLATIGQVTLILGGWGVAQYPDLITPDITVGNAHAPDATLRLLLLVCGAGAIVLIPSLVFLFRLFKGRESR